MTPLQLLEAKLVGTTYVQGSLLGTAISGDGGIQRFTDKIYSNIEERLEMSAPELGSKIGELCDISSAAIPKNGLITEYLKDKIKSAITRGEITDEKNGLEVINKLVREIADTINNVIKSKTTFSERKEFKELNDNVLNPLRVEKDKLQGDVDFLKFEKSRLETQALSKDPKVRKLAETNLKKKNEEISVTESKVKKLDEEIIDKQIDNPFFRTVDYFINNINEFYTIQNQFTAMTRESLFHKNVSKKIEKETGISSADLAGSIAGFQAKVSPDDPDSLRLLALIRDTANLLKKCDPGEKNEYKNLMIAKLAEKLKVCCDSSNSDNSKHEYFDMLKFIKGVIEGTVLREVKDSFFMTESRARNSNFIKDFDSSFPRSQYPELDPKFKGILPEYIDVNRARSALPHSAPAAPLGHSRTGSADSSPASPASENYGRKLGK